MKKPGTGCLPAFAACKNLLLAQFLRATSKSAAGLIPQCCFFVICSLLLQTSLSYQYLIPMQSVHLVLVLLAPACEKGDTGCANVVDMLSRVILHSWSEGRIFHTTCRGGRKDSQVFLLCCVLSYYCFTQCKWLVRCSSVWLSAAISRKAIAVCLRKW